MCPTTHGFVYTIVMVLQSLFSLSVKVPRNATALKRWTLMDSRWKRKEDSLGSPVDRVRSRARSEIKSMPVVLMGPNVSRASGMKTCVLESSWYLACFLVAAASAAAPAVVDVLARYDAAMVSATVASQTKLRPALQGIRVRPSGLLPSDLTNPGGSLTVW